MSWGKSYLLAAVVSLGLTFGAQAHGLDGLCEGLMPPVTDIEAKGIDVTEVTKLQRANIEANLRAFGMDVPDLEHAYVLSHEDSMVLVIVAAGGCVVHMGKVDKKTMDKLTALPGDPT